MPYLGNIPATQFAELKYQDFTGGTGTSFTLNDPVGSAQELEVFVNNVRQEPGVAYTVSGTALTMTGSIVATDDFYVVFQGKSTGTATHPAGQALTATDGTFNKVDVDNIRIDGNTISSTDTNGNITIDPNGTGDTVMTGSGGQVTVDENGHITSKQSLDAATAGGRIIGASNRGTVSQIDLAQATSSADGGYIRFLTCDSGSTSPTERMRLLSGGGLTFNGDTAAANALDDYEEGTFTPTPTVGTINLADAAYTKVGRKVTVHFNAYSFSDRSSTSHIEFTNLPFAADGSIGSTANSGMHRYINAGDSLAFYIPRNQSKIQLFSLNSGSGWTPTQYSHLNSTSAEMYVHLTYFTAT